MSNSARKLLGATAAAEDIDISDYFSTYLYTGNGSTQTITNGIDLAGEGGLVWFKARSGTYGASQHALFDTNRGVLKGLASSNTSAEATETGSLTAFNSDGFNLGSWSGVNGTGSPYASWTFRKAPRFFDVVTYTGNGVAGRTVSHNLGIEPGCIIIKNLSLARQWQVYHRSTGNDKELALNNTDPAATTTTFLNSTDPTSTEFTLGTDINANGSGYNYVAYLFAHDPLGPSGDGSDGLIACGSYTGNGSSNGPEINLGWEPQWLLVKRTDSADNWFLIDIMRGITTGRADPWLLPNTSGAESTITDDYVDVTATGFKLKRSTGEFNANGGTYIYIAIRRGPMREPTSGTEVFAPLAFTSTGNDLNELGYPVDAMWTARRNNVAGDIGTRIQGRGYLVTNNSNAEASFDVVSTTRGFFWDNNIGVRQVDWWNQSGNNMINYIFRRAPGFFDVVCHTSNGSPSQQINHNLGVVPEIALIRDRTGASWFVYHKDLTTGYNLILNSTGGEVQSNTGTAATFTDTYYTPGNSGVLSGGGNTKNYIAYLFATLPGVSKVGSYTGNGSSQTINCGFTGGARFVLIKRTNSTGDWYVWDTARGIVAGNDPHLSLNTTAAEVTTNDSIDPDSSGFIVNQVAATNINVSSASYIYFAIS